MKEHERAALLERVERESATVGVDIPDRITVQGEPVDLRSFVLEVKRHDAVPAGQQERVDRAKKNLRRERLQRKQRLERDAITREEGEELLESIVGIDRALNALESLGATDIEAEARRRKHADEQRWLNFLDQVLGKDGPGSGTRL